MTMHNTTLGHTVTYNNQPLVAFASTPESAWQVYLGGSIAVRETNAGLIQIKTADEDRWTTVASKEVY
jgi:hypothetical protein